MELNEKIQELRKQKGLTQEELAAALYVSRTAVSKWESGRGYPNIDSLKALAQFFHVTVDQLLSGEELLTLAQTDSRRKDTHYRDLVFGLLDCSCVMLLVLPLFGQRSHGVAEAVSLLSLTRTAPYLKAAFLAVVLGMSLWGVVTLALQNCRQSAWERSKRAVSMGLGAVSVLLFIVSQQPYAVALLFLFLGIKGLLLRKTA